MQTHLNHRLVFRRLLLVNGAINPGCQAGWSEARTGERWKGKETDDFLDHITEEKDALVKLAPEQYQELA